MTAVDDLSFADVDEVIAALAAVDDPPLSCSLDPAQVRTPGVWIRFEGPGSTADGDVLGGAVLRLTLFAVVGTRNGIRRELDDLAALWNKIRPVVQNFGGPSGAVTPTGLILPGSTTPMPAFSIPLNLITTQE